MAVYEPTEEDNNIEDDDLDINDPPIHINNPHEPPGELAFTVLGVHLRSRPEISDTTCGESHLESGSHELSLQRQPIFNAVDGQFQAQESKSLPKKNTHPSDGNDTEQLPQKSTQKNQSTPPDRRPSPEVKTRSKQRDKELHARKPLSVTENQPRVNVPAENFNDSRETSSDQQLAAAASGYTHKQQPSATPAPDQQQQLNLVNSTRSQPPISQTPNYTSSSVSAQTSSLPPPQNIFLHPNINSQIFSIPRVPLSVPPVNPASQPDHQTTTPLVRHLNLQDLGIFYERPKKPEYAILAKRIETFQGWPVDSPVAKEDLAKSGLYYEGYGDNGICFFCGGELRKWEQGDDPFVEHARWYAKCGYIRQYKGQAFVDIVQNIKTDFPNRAQITLAMVVEEMNRHGLKESNGSVEHDAAVTSLLDEITSPNSTLRYTTEEVIHAAQILRNQSITLSSDLILSQLTQNHDATDSGAQGATALSRAENSGTIEDLKDQNSTLRNNLICKICMDKEVKIVFLPCGHLVSCQECAMAFYNCPICQSHIRAYVRANIHSM